MLVKLSKQDAHACELMGADTVKLCEMQGFPPRLDNERQSRVEANIYGFKAEFAVARVLGVDPPTVNVLTDGGIDLWFDDISIDVKFTNRHGGRSSSTISRSLRLIAPCWSVKRMTRWQCEYGAVLAGSRFSLRPECMTLATGAG